jgi:hypothetical protein
MGGTASETAVVESGSALLLASDPAVVFDPASDDETEMDA